mgnify:CR=1 FL=1
MLFAIYNKNVGADTPVRPPTLHRTPCKAPCHCETSDRCHWCGNPFSSTFTQGYYGCPCCGAQNFCAALRRTLEILTAATRSLRFLCHRQRSVRSPHRPGGRKHIVLRRAGCPQPAAQPCTALHTTHKAAGPSPRRTIILMHRHFSSAAATNPQNSGCGLSGLLRNSGWN